MPSKPEPDADWQRRYDELVDYRSLFGNTNVPRFYDPNPALGRWVARQRVHYFNKTLVVARMRALESIGFQWSLGDKRRLPKLDASAIVTPTASRQIAARAANRLYIGLLQMNAARYHSLTEEDQKRWANACADYLQTVKKHSFVELTGKTTVEPVADPAQAIRDEMALDTLKRSSLFAHRTWLLGDKVGALMVWIDGAWTKIEDESILQDPASVVQLPMEEEPDIRIAVAKSKRGRKKKQPPAEAAEAVHETADV